MAYVVELSNRAEKDLAALPARTQTRIVTALRRLALDPYRAPGVRKLAGTSDYRLRVGDYRVLYEIQDDRLVVLVVRVAHRRDAYRRKP